MISNNLAVSTSVMSNSAQHIIVHLNTDIGQPISRGWTAAMWNTRNGWSVKLLGNLNAHATQEAEIYRREGDGIIGEKGRIDAVRELATTKTLPQVKWLGNDVTDREATAQGLRKRFAIIDANITDPKLRFDMLKEIRDDFRGLNQQQLDARFALAAEANNVRVMAAMLEAPAGEMVSNVSVDGKLGAKDRALLERAKRLMPEAYQALHVNELLLDYITMLRDWVGWRWLRGLGVDPTEIVRVLGGELPSGIDQSSMTVDEFIATRSA
jgi:hypothetical protein